MNRVGASAGRGRGGLALIILLGGVGLMAAPAPKPVTFQGETFVVRTINDQQQGGMPFIALLVPEKWTVTGEVRWRYENVSVPVTAFVRVTNPAKGEELTAFPRASCFWLQGAAARNQPGSTTLGQLSAQPMPPAQALCSAITQFYRPHLPDLQIVGTRELPDLAALLHADPAAFRGIGAKILYRDNGVAVEEEFHALYYLNQVPYDGPQGRTIQTNWGLESIHSFKAPRGALDQRRNVFAFVMRSVRVNPAWQERTAAIQAYLNDQFNRQLAQGYANIEAAGRLSRQISANNDAMIAGLERQRAATNARAPAAASNRRSANDKFSDYIRGVDTMNDPSTGTSQHAATEQYHWTDGYGSYRHSNDASFNPNLNSTINWTPMTPAR